MCADKITTPFKGEFVIYYIPMATKEQLGHILNPEEI